MTGLFFCSVAGCKRRLGVSNFNVVSGKGVGNMTAYLPPHCANKSILCMEENN
jgi:hypothetical protein